MQKSELRSCKWPPVFQKKIQFCVGEDLAFMIVDLTFHGQWPYHGQWHVFQVRYQPPCSSRFACLASPSNAIGKGAMVPQLFFQAVLASWHM